MEQVYGMRRPGGRVKHIVQMREKPPKYTPARALCGCYVDTMDLADTVGPTCESCLSHPKFNQTAAAEGGVT